MDDDTRRRVAYFLVIYAVIIWIFVVIYYKFNSPEAVTHTEFYGTLGVLGSGIFALFAAGWSMITSMNDQINSISQDLGHVQGRMAESGSENE